VTAPYTPGPWTCVVGVSAPYVNAEAKTVRAHYVINQDPGPYHSAPVTTEAEAKANARLIAAAPDLLAALKAQRCAQCLPTEPDAAVCDLCRLKRAAITKATE